MPAPTLTYVSEGKPLAGWVRAFVLLACAALVAAAAILQLSAREGLLVKTEADAAMLSRSLAQHAKDTFEVSDVLLTTLAERLKTASRAPEDIYILNTVLEAQVRSVTRVRSLIAYDRDGRQFASSQIQVPDWYDLSADPMFKFHESNFGEAVRIGAPTRSPSTNDWILTVSRRWDGSDGRFGGVVVATIRVDYFSNFYRDFNVADEAGITLLSGEGTLLARYPVTEANLGRDFSGMPWYGATRQRDLGTLRFTSPVDGVARIHGYQRAKDMPLLMFVGISETSALKGWLQNCIASIAGAVAVAVALGVAGWKFAAHIDARQSSEREWSKLAMTDALTGVRNRRAFDETIQKEWRLAESGKRTLSLLFVDVDHFKPFNDTYGHPAGDACLRAIAAALEGAMRPGDCLARYGGEEFAMLLSGTDAAGALVAAERIRQCVLHLGIPHLASKTLPLVTISVGVATETFAPGEASGTVGQLIERADRALYRAKMEGRNRVEIEGAAGRAAPPKPLKLAG